MYVTSENHFAIWPYTSTYPTTQCVHSLSLIQQKSSLVLTSHRLGSFPPGFAYANLRNAPDSFGNRRLCDRCECMSVNVKLEFRVSLFATKCGLLLFSWLTELCLGLNSVFFFLLQLVLAFILVWLTELLSNSYIHVIDESISLLYLLMKN